MSGAERGGVVRDCDPPHTTPTPTPDARTPHTTPTHTTPTPSPTLTTFTIPAPTLTHAASVLGAIADDTQAEGEGDVKGE
jgi:hypothetical protein